MPTLKDVAEPQILPEPQPSPIRGALFMVLAAALVAATSLLAKVLGNGVAGAALHPFQVSAGRFVFAFATLLVIAPFLKLRFEATPWRLHFYRSLAGWMGVTCVFTAAARMPLAEATAISFLSPIAAMVLAIPMLGEKVGKVRWSAAALSLLGALILIRPGTSAFQPVALLALASALLMGLETIFIKRLSRSERTIRILFVNNAFGAAIAITVASFVWMPPSPDQWILLVTLGMIMVIAQSCFIASMKSADASYVIPFFYATLVFAALYDFGLFEVVPEAISLLGAVIIVAGAVFLALREQYLKKPGKLTGAEIADKQ